MTVDLTDHKLTFNAPVLPLPPKEYNEAYFSQFNNVLRLYFNQVDNALRSPVLKEQSDAMGWFLE